MLKSVGIFPSVRIAKLSICNFFDYSMATSEKSNYAVWYDNSTILLVVKLAMYPKVG